MKTNLREFIRKLRKIAFEKKFTEVVALTTTFSELLEKLENQDL